MKKTLFIILLSAVSIFAQRTGYRNYTGALVIQDTTRSASANRLYIYGEQLYLGDANGYYQHVAKDMVADSTDWTDGSTVNAIKPRGAKTVEADSAKVGALEVTGNARFNSNVTMITTAGEQVQLGTGSDAAPELSSEGDTNTGIRFPGGDKMQFVQNGLNSHTFRPYWYTMKYSDGDTFNIYLNGAIAALQTNAGTLAFYLSGAEQWGIVSTALYPGTTDSKSLGLPNLKIKNIYGSDYIYLGGKGETATMYISKEATIAGIDSSITQKIGSDGNPYVRYAAADGDSARIHVRSDSTEFYSNNALALDVPAVVTRAGASVKVGAVQWDVAGTDSINGAQIGARTIPDLALPSVLTAKSSGVSDADMGDVTISSGAWAVEDDSHNHTSATTKFVIDDSLRVEETATFKQTYGGYAEQPVTIAESATTFAVTKNNVVVTGDAAGNTVATITGATAIGLYTFRFVDDKVTITDTNDDTANTINLSAAFTSTDDDILVLYWNGTSWREASRSAN